MDKEELALSTKPKVGFRVDHNLPRPPQRVLVAGSTIE